MRPLVPDREHALPVRMQPLACCARTKGRAWHAVTLVAAQSAACEPALTNACSQTACRAAHIHTVRPLNVTMLHSLTTIHCSCCRHQMRTQASPQQVKHLQPSSLSQLRLLLPPPPRPAYSPYLQPASAPQQPPLTRCTTQAPHHLQPCKFRPHCQQQRLRHQ